MTVTTVKKNNGAEFLNQFKGTYEDQGDINSGRLYVHEGWEWGNEAPEGSIGCVYYSEDNSVVGKVHPIFPETEVEEQLPSWMFDVVVQCPQI